MAERTLFPVVHAYHVSMNRRAGKLHAPLSSLGQHTSTPTCGTPHPNFVRRLLPEPALREAFAAGRMCRNCFGAHPDGADGYINYWKAQR